MTQTPTVLTIELTDALIPGRALWGAGPESISPVVVMDTGLARRFAARAPE
jgi:hypothetical protein